MIKSIKEHVKHLRKSNMIRHNYVCSPLINYTIDGLKTNVSYIDSDIIPNSESNNAIFSISENEISPRFVNFHEIVLAIYRDELNKGNSSLHLNTIIEKAKSKYEEINKKRGKKLNALPIVDPNSSLPITRIKFNSTPIKKELNIGLVNMVLKDFYIEQSYLQNPIFDNARREEFNSLLNLVKNTERQIKKKIDVLILPELSVPYNALDWLCDYAQRNQLLMIFGVEHWICKNTAYNLQATLIPFPLNGKQNADAEYNGLLPLLRIKNHYAPDEERVLKSYRYIIPERSKSITPEYFLIEWAGVHFSIFNCFELADIKHRSLFRAKVDVLFACEYNADTHYYSNIVESVVRDLHCYFVQSNNALNGDSRITRPTKSAYMNQIQIKGGKNISVIVDTIDIESIRNHQLQSNIYRDKDSFFKPTPPGYEMQDVMGRKGKDLNK